MISLVPLLAAAFEIILPFVAPVTIRARLLPGVAVQDDDDVTCVQCIGNPKDLCGSSRCDTRKQIGRYRVTLPLALESCDRFESPVGIQLYKIPEPSKARVFPRKLEGASANKRSGANPASLKLLTSPVAPIPVPSVRRPFAVSCCRNQSTAKFVQRAGDVLCRVGGDGNVRVTSATGTIPGQFQMPETYHHGAVVLVNIQDLRARFLRASVSGQIRRRRPAAGGRRSEGRRAWWCTVFPAWLPVVGTGRSGTQSRPSAHKVCFGLSMYLFE